MRSLLWSLWTIVAAFVALDTLGSENSDVNVLIAGDLLFQSPPGNLSVPVSLATIHLHSRALPVYSKHTESTFLYGAPPSSSAPNGKILTIRTNTSSGGAIVAGAFDTVNSPKSQDEFCSVSSYDGSAFVKIGGSLCQSVFGGSNMEILALEMTNSNSQLYVGGSFITRVWNGATHDFDKIENIAHFNATSSVWSAPFRDGVLKTKTGEQVVVTSLAFDEESQSLFMGGNFGIIRLNTATNVKKSLHFGVANVRAFGGMDAGARALYVVGNLIDGCRVGRFFVDDEKFQCLDDPNFAVAGVSVNLSLYALEWYYYRTQKRA